MLNFYNFSKSILGSTLKFFLCYNENSLRRHIMQKTKKFNLKNLKEAEFEVVDKQTLPFKTKGESNDIILLKRKGTKNFFVFEKSQLDSKIKDFLSFCVGEVHPMFYKFKYGDDFFKDAKEFHDDVELDRYINECSSKNFWR